MSINHKIAPSNSPDSPRLDFPQFGKSANETCKQEISQPQDQIHPPEAHVLEFDGIRSERRTSPADTLIRVLIADDHPVVREGLVALIERLSGMQVVSQATNGREAVERFFADHPDVALIDLRMPVMDGVQAVAAICEKDPTARIGIITSFQNEEDIYRALRAGAQGFILKDASPGELVSCVQTLARGKTWIPPRVGAMLARRVADRELTPREIDVLRLVAAGKSNKQIGAAFAISEATVKVHMTHILEKLKVTGRTEAITVAVRRGLVRLDLAAVA